MKKPIKCKECRRIILDNDNEVFNLLNKYKLLDKIFDSNGKTICRKCYDKLKGK